MAMKVTEFIDKLELACSVNTNYLWGTWGNKITDNLIDKKANQYPERYSQGRQNYLKENTTSGNWGFDCIGLIKGILWGWNNDTTKSNGGAVYKSNGVPDTNASGIKRYCTNITSDFSNIVPGEFVWRPGHIGVYVGSGHCIEATLTGNSSDGYGLDGAVKTILKYGGWTEHGKCNFIDYLENEGEDDMKTYIHVESVGLYMRESLPTKNGKKGKAVGFCGIGSEMELIEFIPGIQSDGYQWVKVKAKGYSGEMIEAYSQYDSRCYYLYRK